MSEGKFREEQSRIIVSEGCEWGYRVVCFGGKLAARVLRMSGIIIVLVSEVALHLVSRCSLSSAGAGW